MQRHDTEELSHTLRSIASTDDERLNVDVLRILMKHEDKRTYDDICVLRARFRSMDFMKRTTAFLGPRQEDALCRHLTTERVEAGQFVFDAGDRGDKYYVVLTGEVQVLLPKPGDEVDDAVKGELQQTASGMYLMPVQVRKEVDPNILNINRCVGRSRQLVAFSCHVDSSVLLDDEHTSHSCVHGELGHPSTATRNRGSRRGGEVESSN